MSGKNKKDSKNSGGTIALNKKARHDYFIEETYEAGIALQGWEVKSLRQGRANISEGYVVVKKNELFLFGSTITPLDVACSYVVCDPQRTRKLLLHERELHLPEVRRNMTSVIPSNSRTGRGKKPA